MNGSDYVNNEQTPPVNPELNIEPEYMELNEPLYPQLENKEQNNGMLTFTIEIPRPLKKIGDFKKLYQNSLIFWYNNYQELFDNTIGDENIPNSYSQIERAITNSFWIVGTILPFFKYFYYDHARGGIIDVSETIIIGGCFGMISRWFGSYFGRWWPISCPLLFATGFSEFYGLSIIPLDERCRKIY